MVLGAPAGVQQEEGTEGSLVRAQAGGRALVLSLMVSVGGRDGWPGPGLLPPGFPPMSLAPSCPVSPCPFLGPIPAHPPGDSSGTQSGRSNFPSNPLLVQGPRLPSTARFMSPAHEPRGICLFFACAVPSAGDTVPLWRNQPWSPARPNDAPSPCQVPRAHLTIEMAQFQRWRRLSNCWLNRYLPHTSC